MARISRYITEETHSPFARPIPLPVKPALSDSSALLTRNVTAAGEESNHLGWVFRNAALEAGVLAPTYESACIILHVSTNGEEGCAFKSPLWNNGSNHVMVDFFDKGRWGLVLRG